MPKGASYVPSDLLKEAEAFDAGLPHQNVSAAAAGANFSPGWNPGDADLSGLSYAMYSFSVPDYGGNAVLQYQWIDAPPDVSSVYFAFANWDTDSWNWYAGNGAAKISLPGLQHYMAFGGGLLVCVVATGVNASELDWLHLGSFPPEPSLSVLPLYGLTPLTVSFDASGSTDPDGTIAEYKWDPEGDGSFDVSTGTDPTYSYEYDATGDYAPAVRVIDNNGVYQDESAAVSAVDRADFSYGAPAYDDYPSTAVVCNDGHLFVVGTRYPFHANGQALITKLSPGGSADFTKSWVGDGGDALTDAVLADDSYVYVCGSTASYGGGHNDGLLQKWTQDGQLVWSRTIGSADGGEHFSSMLIHGDSIYVCGFLFLYTTSATYALIARLDREGNVNWAHTIIGPGDCQFNDLAFYSSHLAGASRVEVCGKYVQANGIPDALYAAYDVDGNRVACMTWGTADESEYAEGIATVGFITPQTFVTGYIAKPAEISRGFLGIPGGTTVELSDPTQNDLAPATMLGLNLLIQRYAGGSSSLVLTTFDDSLNLLSQHEVSASPDGSSAPAALISYGGSAFALLGVTDGLLPNASDISIDVASSPTAWVSITPSQGTLTQLVVQDTPTDVTALSGYDFDREASDEDTLVYLSQF